MTSAQPFLQSVPATEPSPATGHDAETVLPSFSVLLPVYNEEGAVETTIQQLHEELRLRGCDYELIVVDDGSTDGTARRLRARDDIRLIRHPQNCGYGAALKTGIEHARHPLIVITDADGTYPNDRIPDLVARAGDADMVVGARNGQHVEYPLLKSIPKWFLHRFAEWMARRPIPDMNSGLRVFRRDMAERFLNVLCDGFSFTTTITVAALTNRYRVHYESIDYYGRIGKSKIRPVRDTLNFIQVILRTGMYFAPLRFFLPVAAVFFVAFLAAFACDVARWNLTQKTLILFIASTQFALFALLADMIDKRNV